jgi:putative peptidoglycan lipid II flippase
VNRLARNTLVVMAGLIGANLVGLLRQIIFNRALGASAETDAYAAAFRVPDLLFNVLAGGALASAFIPLFTSFLVAESGRDRAWRLASAVLNNLLIALGLVGAMAALAAPWIVRTLLAPAFLPAQQQLTVHLMRLMLLSTLIFGVSGLLMGIHNAHHHFLSPALAPILYNLGIMGGALAAPWLGGIFGPAWGVVAGAVLHLLVQLPALIRHHPQYTLALDWGDAALRQVGALMLPRMFGLAVWQINFWVNVAIASALPAGSLSALTYAFQIFTFPQAAIAQAIAIAIFPTFSAQAARGESAVLRHTLTTALSLTLFLALPATIGLMLLGQPLIALLFEGGKFTSASTALVAWALTWYAVGLVGHSVVEVVTRAFFALKDTRTPVLIGVGAMMLNVIFSLTFTGLFASQGMPPHGGLALANSVATGIEMCGLVILLSRRLGRLEMRPMFNSLWRAGLASVGMGAAVIGWAQLVASTWIVGLGGAALGAVVFFVLAFALHSPELQLIRRRA